MKCSCVVLFYENQSSGFGPDWNPAADLFWPAGLMFETPEQHSSISVLFLRFCRSSHTNRLWQKTHCLQALCSTVTSRSPSRTNSRITGLIGSWVFHCRGGVRKADTRTGNFQRFLYLCFFFFFLPFLFVPSLSLSCCHQGVYWLQHLSRVTLNEPLGICSFLSCAHCHGELRQRAAGDEPIRELAAAALSRHTMDNK